MTDVVRPKESIQPDLFGDASNRDYTGVPEGSPERFRRGASPNRLIRGVARRSGELVETSLPDAPGLSHLDPASAYDAAWLRSPVAPEDAGRPAPAVRIVDLFSGCGALSLGVAEACRALGMRAEHILAVDSDRNALRAFCANFSPLGSHGGKVEELLDGEVGAPTTEAERRMATELGHVDVLVGGPPCQGHSNLNNHTRRDDPKNALYLRMSRFAEVVRPDHIIIENVPGVVHDRGGVVQETWRILSGLGYVVEPVTVDADRIGVAQRRRRFFTVASLSAPLGIQQQLLRYQRAERTVRWACEDLLATTGTDVFDTSAEHSEVNQRRIAYLFANDLYDLPDSERPDCHRLKPHSYYAVYGRLRWDEPAPTITTGFGSTGQGRFVHPAEPRTLTPHEAARLQFFPDFFKISEFRRGALQEMIGNAVPPKMGYVLALELLR